MDGAAGSDEHKQVDPGGPQAATDDLQEHPEPSQASKKRAGSPLDDTISGLNPEKLPAKRLKTDGLPNDEPGYGHSKHHSSSTPLESASSYSPDHSTRRTSSLGNLHHNSSKQKSSDDPRPADTSRPDISAEMFQHQASIYPTPQTGGLLGDSSSELPPLQIRNDGVLSEQATPVTLPHFNEIYGNIDFSHHRYSPSTALTPGSAHFQGSISFHQQAYQNASLQHLLSPDKEQQLPLPCQPFLPTPDRLQSLYKIRTQDEQNFQGQLNTIQSQTEGGESSKKSNTDSDYGAPQMARPFQLQDFQYPSAHPSTSRFEASGMIHIPPLHPDQIRAYYGYPAGNTGNPGLGIASSERPLSSSSQINHERPPGNPPLNNDGAPSASTSAFPDLPNAGEYDYSQQQVHLPIFHQQNEPPLNIFRPPHFPPETYNGNRRRQSVLQSWNYGAGSTLAKSPSFPSPYGQAQIHIPPRPTATPSVIPTRVYNPYTATSPGGPPETHDAQRMVDQIDLPTLYHALRYWKSIQRDPHQNLDSRHLAAMNCETLENRIKVVETTKRESSIFSQDQNYGALDTRSNYAGPSNQERSTVFYPTFPTTGRIRTQSSSIVNSPAKDSTSPLVKRSASYTSLPGTSQALTHSQNLRTEGKDPNMNIEPSISPRLSLAEMSTRSKKQGLPVKVELPTSMSRSVSPVATKAPPRKRVSKPSNPAKRVSATLSPAITSENGEPCGSTSRLDLVSIGAETPDPSTMTESSTSAADSPQGSVSGAGGQKKTTRGTSAGKRKNGSPGPIPSDGDGIYKVGDLIFDNDWKRDKDHHVPMKTYIGPITPSNITYTWTESECVAERRLVHVTSTIDIDEKLVHVQFATLDVANYTAEVDTAPYSQGSVVSLIFAEIFPRIPGQNQKPEEIYWISYWDVLKVCEVAIDLVNRTLHFKRTQDFKARLRTILDKLTWVDLRKNDSQSRLNVVSKILNYPAPKPVDNSRLGIKVMPWVNIQEAVDAVVSRLRLLV